jgi:hypothetical protein
VAKITAHGESEVARWVKDGQELVLTRKPDGKPGRLLYKWAKGANWTVVRTGCTMERAEEHARGSGYERRRRS